MNDLLAAPRLGYEGDPLRFGVFLGPYHKIGLNPTLAFQRDLELIQHLEALGYDEVWIGEHHSGGVETIASPELMIAAAAERTSRIKLGTGVNSLPYHHPFMLADRIVMLSHLTQGRVMFGAGPGQLLTDASMLGIGPATQRPRMEEALDVILRLFRGERVNCATDWFICEDAVLQLRPHSPIEVAVTGAISPSGPSLAGRHGVGLLSLAATDPTGVDRLAAHWSVVEAEATKYGQIANRASWRLMGPMHISETVAEATAEVEYGLEWFIRYLSHISPSTLPAFSGTKELVEILNASGRAVIGTPDMAIRQLERLADKSGGFGAYLFQGADYARWPAMLRSYELFAEEVAPRFTGQLAPLVESFSQVIDSGTVGAETTARSQAEAAERYRRQAGDAVNASLKTPTTP